MKLTPLSKSIQLTERTTSNTLNIASALIQRIDTAPGGSCLSMLALNDSVRTKKQYVTETPSAVAALTGIHVELTETAGRTWYLNAMCVRNLFDETTYRVIEYNYGGQTFKAKVTQSLATLRAAINAANTPATSNSVPLVAAGTTQGTATLATVNAGEATIFPVSGATTAATAAGVVLSAETTVGTKAIFYNSSSSFFLQVYPASGGTIENMAANAAFALAPLSAVEFTLGAANAWEASVVQSSQAITAAGTGATGDAAQFLASAARLNIVFVRSATGAANGVRPILPTSDGSSILFINTTTNNYLQAFPPTGDNFGLGADIPLPIPPNGSVLMVFTSAHGWKIAYGFNIATQSGTASTTQTQPAGTQIYSAAVNATTVANSADAFTISRNLRSFTMTNTGANYAQVFPPVGGTIDAGAANAACRVYPDSTLLFTSNDGLAWKLSGTRVASATLVAGAATIDDGNIRATSNVNIQRLAVLGTIVSVHLLPTITAVTNVVVQSQDIAAGNDLTDISTIRVTINY